MTPLTPLNSCSGRVRVRTYDPFSKTPTRVCLSVPNVRDRETGKLYCQSHRDLARDPEPLKKLPLVAPRDIPFQVHVTDHAREQARARFPGFKAARIVDEVRLAFREGRFSGNRPAGFASDKDEGYGFFAWTPDGKRIYAMRTDARVVAVTTVVPAFGKCDPRPHGPLRVIRCPHGCVTRCARDRAS